jgi:HSP20 family protein
MALVRWNPLMTRWPSLFEDEEFGFSDMVSQANNNLDLYETDDQVVVKANVAGVDADDLDLTYEKDTLWIQAEKSEEEGGEEKKHYRKSSWRYAYRVSLPADVDLEAEPEAEMDNGVLTVTFNKSERSKPRKLSVKTK